MVAEMIKLEFRMTTSKNDLSRIWNRDFRQQRKIDRPLPTSPI
jgi:hypothetical protein